MPTVLILSSFVAASRVGGGMQALALSRLGIEPILARPCSSAATRLGAPPGGKPVEARTLAAMLQGIDAQGMFRPGWTPVINRLFRLGPTRSPSAARTLDTVARRQPRGAF